MLFSIIVTIDVGIGTYFIYYKYMNRNKETGAKESFNYQAALSYWTYKWDKSNKLSSKIELITFLMTWLISKTLIKSYKDIDIYYIGYIKIKKIGDC